ncbi:unnamed protein product [Cylicocyclus nassatus]|uniref:Uncharacterized protein n=1 Tax=Cylicocyclus nassatus TaxID=53992 RepID=A0AA36DRI4_CYLNA|nr:unnamed protein product [Cylicocyclus nassatus]
MVFQVQVQDLRHSLSHLIIREFNLNDRHDLLLRSGLESMGSVFGFDPPEDNNSRFRTQQHVECSYVKITHSM